MGIYEARIREEDVQRKKMEDENNRINEQERIRIQDEKNKLELLRKQMEEENSKKLTEMTQTQMFTVQQEITITNVKLENQKKKLEEEQRLNELEKARLQQEADKTKQDLNFQRAIEQEKWRIEEETKRNQLQAQMLELEQLTKAAEENQGSLHIESA